MIVVDIDEKKGNELVENLKEETNNHNIIFQNVILLISAILQILIDRALDKFGKIDALVNNAYPRNKNYGKIRGY